MMLVHMEVYLKGYFLMSISLQKYTVWSKDFPQGMASQNNDMLKETPYLEQP